MPRAVLKIDLVGEHEDLIRETRKIAGPKADTVFAKAINHVGDRVFTQVKRTVAKQVGLTIAETVAEGGLRTLKASPANLQFQIRSTGRFIPLNRFKAAQFSKGVKASPWGRRQLFPSSFIVAKFGGNVFVREGPKRFPIKKLWGPAVPREMVRDETAAAFHAIAAERLPKRVRHELSRLTGGVYS